LINSINHKQKKKVHFPYMQALHAELPKQNRGHLSAVVAVVAPAKSAGIADIDDVKAATTARTIAEEKRIVCDSCDMGSSNSARNSIGRRLAFMYSLESLLRGCAFEQMHICNASRLPAG
jgi:hypothetical protein